MSERIDRRMGSGNPWLVTLALVVVFAGAAGTYLWLQKDSFSPVPPVQEQSSAAPLRPTEEPLMVTIYVPGNGMLSAGLAAVERQSDTQAQARAAMVKAFAGMSEVQTPVLKDLKLREFFLDAAGTAFVDLSLAGQGIRASAEEELLALYAVVNTLTHNFEEIKQVRFLIEGKEAQTLAGHIDVSRTFLKRMDLIKQ